MKITQAPAVMKVTAPARRATANEYQAAKEVSPQVSTPDSEITRYGSVSSVGMSDGSFVSITLTPGTTAKEYVIGDAFGLIEAAMGKNYDEPTSIAGSTPAAFKAATQQGIAIKGVHYQVTTSKNQFSNPLRVTSGNYDGSLRSVPVNVVGTTRPDWQNDKLVVIEFKQNIILDSRNALTLTVNGGESVNLTLYIGAYGF